MAPNKTAAPDKISGEKMIVVLGEAGVGKSCFIHKAVYGDVYVELHDYHNRKSVVVDNHCWILQFEDLSSSILHQANPAYSFAIFNLILRDADAVILLYDITSRESFDRVTKEAYEYVWKCRTSESRSADEDLLVNQRFGCVLVGTKLDLAAGRREVGQTVARSWAESQGIEWYELDQFTLTPLNEIINALVRGALGAAERDVRDFDERCGEQAGNVKHEPKLTR